LQQIDDLRFHGDIEGRNRFVTYDQLRLTGQARAMQMRWALTPENSWGQRFTASRGNLTKSVSLCQPLIQICGILSQAIVADRLGQKSLTRMRGFRLLNGSWKTTPTRRRMDRNWRAGRLSIAAHRA